MSKVQYAFCNILCSSLTFDPSIHLCRHKQLFTFYISQAVVTTLKKFSSFEGGCCSNDGLLGYYAFSYTYTVKNPKDLSFENIKTSYYYTTLLLVIVVSGVSPTFIFITAHF